MASHIAWLLAARVMMTGFKWSGVMIKGLARVRHKAVKTVNLLTH